VQFQHLLIDLNMDLDLPIDLEFLLDNLTFPLSKGQPLTIKKSLVYPSMLFHLISSNIRAATTYSSVNVVELLPIATTRLSHESGKEHNKMIHFSSLVIFVRIFRHLGVS
jgi:hypothetical protein